MKLRTDPVHVGDICTVGIFCLPGDDRDLADVNDIKIDKTGGAQVAYTFETADRTHTQIDFQCQSGGPGLYAGVPVRDCHLAPVVVTNPRPPAGEPSASGGGSLASTGGLPYAVPAAFLFVLALMFTRRRRRS
jgi:hypothetical protein